MIIQYIFYLKQCTQHKGEKCENECIRQSSWPIRDERNERCGCVSLFGFPSLTGWHKSQAPVLRKVLLKDQRLRQQIKLPLRVSLSSSLLPCILLSLHISGLRWLLQLQCQVAGTEFDGNSVPGRAGETSAVSQVSNSTSHRSAFIDFIIYFHVTKGRQAGRTSLVPFIKTIERQQLYTVFINQVGKRKGKSLLQHKVEVNAEFSGATQFYC